MSSATIYPGGSPVISVPGVLQPGELFLPPLVHWLPQPQPHRLQATPDTPTPKAQNSLPACLDLRPYNTACSFTRTRVAHTASFSRPPYHKGPVPVYCMPLLPLSLPATQTLVLAQVQVVRPSPSPGPSWRSTDCP